MLRIIFKVLTNHDITYIQLLEAVTRHYPHWSFIDNLKFLLTDDLNLERTHRYDDRYDGDLNYGRQKRIFQWDLKFLSAYCIIFRSLARLFQIPMSDELRKVDPFTMSDYLRFATGTIPDDMIKELVYWCIKINGKEEIFFTPFNLKCMISYAYLTNIICLY